MAKQKKEQKSISKSSPKSASWISGKRLYAIIIFAFSCALYFNTLFNDYNLDDELVTNNHQVTSKGWNVLKLNFDAFNSVDLKDSSFAQKLKYFMPVVFRVPYYQDKAGFKYEYRPMVFASFALEHALFSKTETVSGKEIETDSSAVSHLINILLYALACTLLFYVLSSLFRTYNVLIPFVVSLLFVAYPMHTEVVASIKNRDELLALIFGLLSVWFSLVYSDKSKVGQLILVALFFVLGILSKPTTIIFAMLIPLCVVMFRNTSYLRLIVLTFALIIPAVFFSRLYSAAQQVALGLELFLAVTALYVLKNRSLFWTEMKGAFVSSYKYFSSSTTAQNADIKELEFNFLKNPVTAITLALLITIPLTISVFGIYEYNSWLACIPLLIFGVTYAFVRNELKAIFTTPLILVSLFAIAKFFPGSTLMETGLIVFLGCQIFSGQKVFRAVGISNYILFSLVSVICLHSFHFVFLVLFIGLLNRKFFFLSLIAIAVSCILFFRNALNLFHGHGSLFGAFVLLPIIYVFVFLLWKNWWKQAIGAAAIIIPISLVIYFTVIHPQPNNNVYYAIQRTYYKVNNLKAADPTPVQSVRPLIYAEYPLSYSDPFSLRFGTGMEVLGKYLKMTFIPYPMSFYYGYSCITPQNISEPLPLISLLIYIVLAVIGVYFFRKIPLLSFSILFYLISIVVFSNIVSPIPGMLGDRFLLIPSIGFCVFIFYVLTLIFKQHFEQRELNLASLKLPFQLSLGAILLLYSGLTFSRNMDWKDRLTLFRHDIKVVDNSAQAHNLLAVHLLLMSNQEKDPALQKQLREEAIPHFKRALEIYKNFVNPSYDLGRTYEALHMDDEAMAQYQNTVKLDTTLVLPYFNMATIMQNKGRYTEAIAMYQKFLTQYPRQIEAYTNLSFAYFKLNDFEKSIATNQTAIMATGEPFFPTVNIAKTYMVMNQPDSALIYWEQAHAMKPGDAGINTTIEQLKAQHHQK